jgi:hypothetical protein
MKTTIEVHGFEIKIDEMEGKVLVSAMKDGETIEEFELEVEGFEGSDDDMDEMGEMEPFGGEGEEEEEDFDGEEEDEMDEEEEDDEEGKLESFSHFVKRRKK